jgi:5,10-methenyltetrahydromethanopterin hydrogenase
MTSVASAFSAIADRFTQAEQVTKLNGFLTANQQTLGVAVTQSIRNAVTEAEWQMEWATRNSPNVLDFLIDRRNSASITTASCLMASVILAIVMFVL